MPCIHRLSVAAFAAAALCLTPAFAATPKAKDGASHIEKALPSFTEIEMDGVGDLEIRQGDKEAISIDGAEDVVKEVTTEVKGNKLIISQEDDWRGFHWRIFGRERRASPHFVLWVKTLRSIETAGAGSIRADALSGETLHIESSGATSITLNGLKVQKLDIDSSGASKISLSGTVDTQTIDLSGACKYEGRALASRQAELDISGAGKAEIRASESLKATISGVGKIDYYGSPKLTQDISGIGRIRRAGD